MRCEPLRRPRHPRFIYRVHSHHARYIRHLPAPMRASGVRHASHLLQAEDKPYTISCTRRSCRLLVRSQLTATHASHKAYSSVPECECATLRAQLASLPRRDILRSKASNASKLRQVSGVLAPITDTQRCIGLCDVSPLYSSGIAWHTLSLITHLPHASCAQVPLEASARWC